MKEAVSWEKQGKIDLLRHVPGKMEVEKYVYTPGIHGLEFAKALREGKILAGKCGEELYVPPKTFCPNGSPEELVDVTDAEWEVVTYTIIHEDLEGNKLSEPQIVAVVKPVEAVTGLIHYVKADPDLIHPGMRVRPVFKKPEERKGLITDIEYFEPV